MSPDQLALSRLPLPRRLGNGEDQALLTVLTLDKRASSFAKIRLRKYIVGPPLHHQQANLNLHSNADRTVDHPVDRPIKPSQGVQERVFAHSWRVCVRKALRYGG